MSAHDHRTHASNIAGALGGAAMVGYLLPGLAGAWPALRAPLGIEDRTSSGRGYALTFDDGPHAQGTPAVLEILSRERVRATFFLVGEQVLRNPAIAREIADAGHGVGLHCHRHRNLLRLTPRQVREDIATGPRGHRGPTPAARRSCIARRTASSTPPRCASRERAAGARCCGATGAGTGRRAPRPRRSPRASPTAPSEGAVLLLHDADDYSAPGSWRRTAAALPRVLEILAERDLEPVEP